MTERTERLNARDLLALTKPRLSSLVLCTTAGGMWLAPGAVDWPRSLVVLAATALLVAGAQTLNSYLERDVDALMLRTQTRPLPAGRIDPRFARLLGFTLAAVSLPVLAIAANVTTALLGLVAIASYVALYTPLKRRSTWALAVGAVPGAIPPAMGWTSVQGRLDAGALALFAILFVWQLPHFLAISIYLKDDYARADLKVFAVVHGDRAAKLVSAATSLLLIPVTLALVPLGIADEVYGAAALVLGFGFFVWSLTGLRARANGVWARRYFLGSLAYLSFLLAALAVGSP